MFGFDPFDMLLDGATSAVNRALAFLAGTLASWLMTSSKNICPTQGSDPATWDPNWLQTCNDTSSAATQLRELMLPLTAVVLLGGMLWQAILMVISRKGEPLLQAARGLFNTALWGSIGVGAAHLMLKFGDGFSAWVIDQSVAGNGTPADKLRTVVTAMVSAGDKIDPLIGLFINGVAVGFIIVQILLMTFRDGGVIIMAGLKQFAAAGSATQATSGWGSKTTSWMLALIAYKPSVALIYATAWKMLDGDVRDLFTGLGIVILSVIALPVLLKFFTVFTGHIANSGGGGLASAAAGAASTLHATASLRGVGGNSAAEHARYLDSTGPGAGRINQPTGAVAQHSGTAPTAMPAAGAAGTAGAGAGAGADAAGAGAGTAGAATAAGAAAGPAAPAVLAGAAVAQAATATTQAATSSADSATGSGSTS
jgi:type IV secretion system protein TrbL